MLAIKMTGDAMIPLMLISLGVRLADVAVVELASRRRSAASCAR